MRGSRPCPQSADAVDEYRSQALTAAREAAEDRQRYDKTIGQLQERVNELVVRLAKEKVRRAASDAGTPTSGRHGRLR